MLYLVFLLFCYLPVTLAQVGTFWQITDVHIELNYSTTGDTNNDCRGINFRKEPLGKYGDFSCDSNLLLLQDSVNAMRKINPNPDFILWTGDNFPHVNDSTIDWNQILISINKTTSVITSAFPNVPLIPVLGNHDVYPKRHFPWNTFPDHSDKYLEMCGWNKFIPKDQLSNWKKGGYYSVQINSKLTILVTNTFLYQFYYDGMGEDPKGQFAWLIEQLEHAQKNSISIIVTSHIPPGVTGLNKTFLIHPYTDKYVSVMMQFDHVILAQVYGHLHCDSFRLFYDSNDNLKGHAFIGPSVTPWKSPQSDRIGNNPCVRFYNYSISSNYILDYQQYCLNFTLANKMADEGKWPPGDWDLFYKAAELYNVPNMNLTSVANIFQMMKTNETVFNIYYRNFLSGLPGQCDDLCRKFQLCFIIADTDEQIVKNCLNL